MHICRFTPSWICHFIACMGGCFGCCAKPSTINAVDQSSKGLRIKDERAKQHSIPDDFWSSSAGDMDYSGVQSQRSASSISALNQPFDPSANAGSTSNPSEFVNYGLLLWKQTRQQWLANKGLQTETSSRTHYRWMPLMRTY
uniref:Gag1-like clamp domain-containing protein n=1 Tax=Jatropha curcas TaxID=180498 RepID=E2CXF8_JATCU|nr:hypothetical protein [Jatropha curcas]